MKEIVVSKKELVEMFSSKEIVDTGDAWVMNLEEVDIIAIHKVDPKFLKDVSNSEFYKIIFKGSR